MSRKYVLDEVKILPKNYVSLCESKSCEVTSCQSWRIEKKNWRSARVELHAGGLGLSDDGIILKVLWIAIFQPFNLHSLTVPLWKGLNLL